jgi:hypothetical protein
VPTRIIDLLADDNFSLLEVICHSAFVGDTAATISRGVLALLEASQVPCLSELFIARIFKTRSNEYCNYH